MDLKIKTDEPEPQRKPEPGTWWSELENNKAIADEEFLYAVTTCGAKGEKRGGRKVAVSLPSGRTIRVFRAGIAFGYKEIATGKQDSDEFVLDKDDALFLWRMPLISIKRIRETIEVTDNDIKRLNSMALTLNPEKIFVEDSEPVEIVPVVVAEASEQGPSDASEGDLFQPRKRRGRPPGGGRKRQGAGGKSKT